MSNFLDDLLDERTSDSWIDQNSPEWNQVRIGRFTASELHRLMEPAKREMTPEELKSRPPKGTPGASAKLIYDYSKLSDAAMTYVNEKVAEVMTGQAKQQGYAFPLIWGLDHEDEAVEYFTKVTGLSTEKVGFFKYTDHCGGSPDRFVSDGSILEVKCPHDSVNQVKYLLLTDHYDIRRDYFQYWVQCQANMLFTDRSLAHFVTFDPRMKEDKHKLTHIEIPADAEFHDLIAKQIVRATKEKLQLLNLLA